MPKIFKKFILSSTFMGLILAHSMLRADAPKPAQVISDLKGKYLFVQTSELAIIKPIKNETNTYTITLKNVNHSIIYISDRPNRKTGQLLIEQFLKLWEFKEADSLKNNPPNVVLNSIQSSHFFADKNASFAFVITNPIYDAKAKTLSYTAKGLDGTPQIEKSSTLEHVSLFIDDVCLSCW